MRFLVLFVLPCALTFANIISSLYTGQSPLSAVQGFNNEGGSLNVSASGNYRLGQISHAGSRSIYDLSYQVYRNVLDFGARGDGIQDDTNAIQNAISCRSSADIISGVH
jgi:glucan 1,3-beta-glucosidase